MANPWIVHVSKVRKSLSQAQLKKLGVSGIAKLAKKTYKSESCVSKCVKACKKSKRKSKSKRKTKRKTKRRKR